MGGREGYRKRIETEISKDEGTDRRGSGRGGSGDRGVAKERERVGGKENGFECAWGGHYHSLTPFSPPPPPSHTHSFSYGRLRTVMGVVRLFSCRCSHPRERKREKERERDASTLSLSLTRGVRLRGRAGKREAGLRAGAVSPREIAAGLPGAAPCFSLFRAGLRDPCGGLVLGATLRACLTLCARVGGSVCGCEACSFEQGVFV